MERPDNLDDIMRRIQKLLAIANDDRANPAEAASAANMAEKIMRKYQLDNATVILAALRAGDDMGTEDCLATAKTNGTKIKSVPSWATRLAVQVALFNDTGAKIYSSPDGNSYVQFYGFMADVTMSKHMFNYLVAVILRLSLEFKNTMDYEIGGRSLLADYRKGVSVGICKNLIELRKVKKTEMESTSNGTSLIVVKRDAVAERFGAFKTKKTGSSIRNANSFDQGVYDGRQVDVNRRSVSGPGAPLRITD